jgi:hypothetical protein
VTQELILGLPDCTSGHVVDTNEQLDTPSGATPRPALAKWDELDDLLTMSAFSRLAEVNLVFHDWPGFEL